jgi:hypothetical protein
MSSHAQILEWTRQLGVESLAKTTEGLGVSSDGMGNVYLSGHTFADLDGLNAGHADVFLSKYDAAGNQAWVRQLGSSHQDEAQSVSADTLGNVFIAGETGGGDPAPGIGGIVVPLNDWEAYIARYDASGNLDWVRQFGTAKQDWALSVAADGLGNAYVTGITDGDLAAPNAGTTDAFLSKYDEAGNLIWARQFGSMDFDSSRAVSYDGSAYAYVAGWTRGNLSGPNAGEEDAFVAKFDAAGNQLWLHQFGTTGTDGIGGVSADGMGNVFVGGSTNGSLGGLNAGGYDAFVRKYDAAGNHLWTRQLGSTVEEGPEYFKVSADGLGNVYLAGWTEGNLGGPNSGGENSPYRRDAFLAKYDGSGNLDWIWQSGTGANEGAAAVSADGLGNAYVAGLSECHRNDSYVCPLEGAYAFVAKIRDDPAATLPGDFNTDRTVDAADYVVWRNGLGSSYTQTDYDLWRVNFGQSAGSAGSLAGVPEPRSALLFAFACAPLLLLLRAHHSACPVGNMFGNQNRRPIQCHAPALLVWVERCLHSFAGDKHRSTQTSCEETKQSFDSASGFQTSDHLASSGGAEPHRHGARSCCACPFRQNRVNHAEPYRQLHYDWSKQ